MGDVQQSMSTPESPLPEDNTSLQEHLYSRVNYTLVRDLNFGDFTKRPVRDADELQATRIVAIELMQEAEKWRILNQRRLVALEAVEWIMVNGRIQCPSCLHSQTEGHGVLCSLDEALRPTAEKANLREKQCALYAACHL
jgi:hypothetical protein